ncbi:MAG: 5-bromo-4-chloroindolyl phosphate hydrolysis family protein [Lachnospiraceae bacterium]|nr:5-bromo-4-chloroindolyl phosphate hydrolysis family protein [Lachnospiraceae bacterium]MBR6485294.1 5-bromo-4-chloroindolyl phosphate hydrolysis family protein [Lachnospiraceae bacterium]
MADNQLLNQIGDEIKESLKVSLSRGDFSRLNEAISNSVNMVIDEATDHLEKSTGYRGSDPVNVSSHRYSSYASGAATRERQKQLEREREERARARREQLNRERTAAFERRREQLEARRQQADMRRKLRSPDAIVENGKLLPIKFKAIGDNSSVLQIVFGCIGEFIGLTMSLALAVSLSEDPSNLSGVIFFLTMAVASGGLIYVGTESRKLLDRARRYARICGAKMYAKVSQIASATGFKEKKIRKDIKKMLSKGFFPEGYLDAEETTLMLSNEVYKDYTQMLSRAKVEAQEAADGKLTGEEKSELEIMIADGMAAVGRLHKLNEDIPGEVITKKLDCLEGLLKQMFDRVSEHPEQMDRMHKLMDYYLPTMLKLVEAYSEYDKVTAPGKEIVQAKAEIEKTLDTINEAFVQLLNNLFQDSVWDVTSDAQVLTTMLTQEGLTQESALK